MNGSGEMGQKDITPLACSGAKSSGSRLCRLMCGKAIFFRRVSDLSVLCYATTGLQSFAGFRSLEAAWITVNQFLPALAVVTKHLLA
jgi:hypothetical protein